MAVTSDDRTVIWVTRYPLVTDIAMHAYSEQFQKKLYLEPAYEHALQSKNVTVLTDPQVSDAGLFYSANFAQY